jgi:16S rRNA (cytosine967-C5)-methyltransferase
VRDGGTLLYSTCTLNRRENEAVVEAFLAAHTEFSAEKMHTFFPDTEGTDGFFYCKMKKSTDC